MEELVSAKEPTASVESTQIHTLEPSNKMPMKPAVLVIILLVIVLFGVGTGYVVANKSGKAGTSGTAGDVEVVKSSTEEGVKDASTFKDTATGTLVLNDGKLTKEGEYVLTRGADVSQNVYLTSSVVDLSKYVGKKVQIWGATFQGQSAGWLMDVGRVKLVE